MDGHRGVSVINKVKSSGALPTFSGGATKHIRQMTGAVWTLGGYE